MRGNTFILTYTLLKYSLLHAEPTTVIIFQRRSHVKGNFSFCDASPFCTHARFCLLSLISVFRINQAPLCGLSELESPLLLASGSSAAMTTSAV